MSPVPLSPAGVPPSARVSGGDATPGGQLQPLVVPQLGQT